jgi:DNA-binding transcriptional MocR family regulator
VVEIVSEHALPVLEDDPYCLVRFEGTAPPTLYELEGGDLVTYTSSFSKTVAPGLRTGYFVLPEGEASSFEARANSTYISPPFLTQATIFEFLDRGHLEPNLERVCASLRARRDAMLAALESSFPARASWNQPEGGYFLWLDLGAGADAAAVGAEGERRGVAIVPGPDFFAGVGGFTEARLAFSYEPAERIAEGIGRLAELLG